MGKEKKEGLIMVRQKAVIWAVMPSLTLNPPILITWVGNPLYYIYYIYNI